MKNFTRTFFTSRQRGVNNFLVYPIMFLLLLVSSVSVGQTSTQTFGTGTGSNTSQTGNATTIPNPTVGTTYARAGATAPNAPVAVLNSTNPLGSTGSFLKATASSTASVTKASPIVSYTTATTEFYTSFKVLLGDSAAGNSATSGIWTFYQGLQGTNYNDNTDVSSANTFTGLRFTYGASGALTLTYNNNGTYNSTGLTTSTFSQGTVYTIEIVGNNKTSGTINYTYNGVSQSVAVQKFDLYIDGTLIGNDLSKGGAAANTNINAMTWTGISSTSNVANLFLDDVAVSNAVPASIGTAPSNPSLTITANTTAAFGSVCTNASPVTNTFTVTNSGTAATNVVVTSNNSQYVVSNLSATSIGAGGSATFDVTYTPTSGSAGATISSFYNTNTLSGTLGVTGSATTPVLQGVTTQAASNIAGTTATLNGNVTTLGVCPSTNEKGFVYALTSVNNDPLVSGTGVTKTTVATIVTGAYSLNLSSLATGTGYSYKAYVYDGTTYTYGALTTFTTATPPGNDLCSNVSTLTVNNPVTSGTLVAATNSANTFTYASAKNDVWYKFSPTVSGSHTVTLTFTTATNRDIDFDIFTSASCPTSGTADFIAHGSTTTETATATLSAGTVYYIRVIDFGTVNGDVFNISVTGPAIYYSKATGDLNLLTTWGTNTDGSGTNPANFTAANQIFNVVNNAAPTIGAAWTVSGAGSKVILGDGTNAIELTLPAGLTMSGTIDVSNNGTLTLQNTTFPTFGTLSAGSTISYAGSGITQAIVAANYSNLTLAGTGTRTFPSGIVGVGGVFNPGTGFSATQGTINFSSAGIQTIPAFNYFNITNTGNGDRILASSGVIGIAGANTPTTGVRTITGSTVNFNGTGAQTINAVNYNNLTISGARTGSPTITLASGTIGIAGLFTVTATGVGNYTLTGNTVNYNGSVAQTVSAFTYNNITASNVQGVTTSGAVNFNGALTVNEAMVVGASSTLTINSGGSVTIAAAKNLTVNASGTIQNNSTVAFVVTGTLTINGVYVHNANSNTLPSTNTTYASGSTIKVGDGGTNITSTIPLIPASCYNVIWNAPSQTAGSNFISATTVSLNNLTVISTGTGFITNGFQSTARTLNIAGDLVVSGGKYYVVANNVALATANQTTNVTGNLSISGTGVVNISQNTGGTGTGVLNVGGNVSFTAGTFGNAASSTSGTLTFNGSTQQVFSSIGMANAVNVTINNAAGVSLNTNMTVGGTLTFSSGKITTNSFKVIANGPVVGGGTGWVIGNLQKPIPTGSPTGIQFEIGGASNYRNVSIDFTNVTTGGNLTASVSQSNAVYTPLTGSGLDPTKLLQRYFTLSGSGIVFANYDVTVNFVASDVVGVSTNYVMRRYNGSSWASPVSSTASPLSNKGSGFASFGDLVIGEPTGAPTLITNALAAFGNVCVNTTAGPNSFTITGSNLTADPVTVSTALTGYTFSTDNISYSSSLSIVQGGGNFSQLIYVKFSPVSTATNYNGNIIIGGGGASNYNVAASGAGIDSPPTVTVGSASSIGSVSATVSGNITAPGCSLVTTYGIEYSTTNGFANGTGSQVSASNLSGTSFSAGLTGLAPTTTYYYKTYATNNGGTAYSSQGSFTTATPVLTVGTLTAFGANCIGTTVGPNSFTLSGTNMTGADVIVAALSGYTYSLLSGGTYTPSLTLSGFNGTSTPIYVKFSPLAVQSYNGNIAVSTTGATTKNVAASGSGINTAPTVTTVAAGNITATTATLNASNLVSNCNTVSAYGFSYGTANDLSGATTVNATNLVGGNFSLAISDLSPNTTYYFRASGTSSSGTGTGNILSFTTSGLTAPTANTATAITANGFNANWTTVAGATGYRLDVSTSSTFGTTSTNVNQTVLNNPGTIGAAGWTETSITQQGGGSPYYGLLSNASTVISPAMDLTNYSNIDLGFRARTFGGVSGSSNVITASISTNNGSTWTTLGTRTPATTTLTAMTVFDISAYVGTQVKIRLQTLNATGSVGVGIDDITVIGDEAIVTPSYVFGYQNLSTGDVGSFPVTGLTPNTTYYYRVRATSTNSTSANSNVISVLTRELPQGSLSANGPFCASGAGQLTFSATAGTGPFTIVYSDGSNNYTENGVVSGTAFNIATNPITANTTFTLVSVTDANGSIRSSNFTQNSATIIVNSAPSAVLNGGTTICSGETTNLSVTIAGGTSPYTIVYTDGTDNFTLNNYITGSNIPVSPTTSTTYSLVSVTGANGCAGTGNSVIVSISTNTTWTGSVSNVWTTASNWSCGVPFSSSDVTIGTGTFQPQITTSPAIHSLTINSGASLTITSAHNLTVTDAILNNGTLTVENNANLVQANDVSNTGSGSAIVHRDSNALYRLDYTMWSSPVSGQNLLAFSPLTSNLAPTNIRFYTYNGLNDTFTAVSSAATTDFATATGYLIRMPNNAPAFPTSSIYHGVFTGTPHNGNISVPTTPELYYGIGNPYPSTMSADAFISANVLKDAIYFWRKTNNAAGSAYATYTFAGGASPVPGTTSGPGDPNSTVPNGIIQVGQGFITKAPSTSLNFSNAMRVANNAGQFFRSAIVNRSRIWLNLTNANGLFSQTLIAYMDNATSGVDDAIDGRYFNDSQTALTSIINNEEFAIQGRALPFVSSDIVPLGFKTALAGDFTISINSTDGLFATGNQLIYLKDNVTGSIHNLTAGDYHFTSDAGVFNTRFEIVYEDLLATSQPEFSANNVVVYKQGQDIVVNTGTQRMSKVEIYDVRGRLVAQKTKIDATEARLQVNGNQMLIVKITSQNNGTVTKKVIN